MNRSVCPYLGTLDSQERPSPAVEYPSLENQCFAVPPDELLLLGDQATFCLSGGHRHCPRFQATQRSPATGGQEPAGAPVPFGHTLGEEPAGVGALFGELSEALHAPSDPARRRWVWAGAGLIFVTVLLCGGIVAAYTGWQLVSARYLEPAPGQIDTLSNQAATVAPLYLVVTATSAQKPPPADAPAVVAVAVTPTPLIVAGFPAAVTPTPVVIDPNVLRQQPSERQPLTNTTANNLPSVGEPVEPLAPPENISLPTPAIDLQVEVPTRRPTPVFDLPTSTPEPIEPTPTATPTRVLGTPVVQFAPLQYALREGECTLLRWQVENVQAVYYENQGVDGVGQREVCLGDEPQSFRLAVVLPDGSTSVYTATVDYLPPTPTLTPTPSFTPIGENPPTPTWTPDAPTVTPTPPTFFNVTLEIFGESRHACSPTSTCEFSFLATNLGNAPDNLVITLIQSGPWQSLLCDDGGNCATSSLSLSNVTPSAAKLVTLKVNVPADATTQTVSYGLQVVSSGSGGTVTSSAKTIEVEVP